MAKRINLIVKGEGIISSLLSIREKKVMRAVEAALDQAEEKKLDAQVSALKALELLGKNADCSCGMTGAINKYCDAKQAERDWEQAIKDIQALKKDLNEEVEEESELK